MRSKLLIELHDTFWGFHTNLLNHSEDSGRSISESQQLPIRLLTAVTPVHSLAHAYRFRRFPYAEHEYFQGLDGINEAGQSWENTVLGAPI